MILITKEETAEIRRRFPKLSIYRTAKQRSKRHRYWCCEEKAAAQYIQSYRTAQCAGTFEAIQTLSTERKMIDRD